jgi:hypothetical protein
MVNWRKLPKAFKSLSYPLFRDALLQGVSASYEHQGMLVSLRPLRTVIDVGAYVGQFALIVRHTQPDAIIHCFESLPDAAARFLKVTASDPRIKLHRFALGEKRKKFKMLVTARADSSSLLPPEMQSSIYPNTHEVAT